jgi:hypothetical protein
MIQLLYNYVLKTMKVIKIKDEIHFIVPFWTKRSNPWTEGDVGSHPTLVGIISADQSGNKELGFAEVIDMDYKDKGDQETEIMIHYWSGDKEDFIKLCKELGIDYIEYPLCAYCGQPIFGCFTWGEKGHMCYKCEDKNQK